LFGAFCVYGWLLVEAGRHDEAARSLETAILLNPMNCEPLLELSEVCKMRGDLDGFLMHTMKALGIAYTGADLGRCYRNYGYFEIERGNYALASALFWHSLSFDPDSGMAWNELKYLRALTGKPLREPSVDEIKDLLAANGIPPGPSVAVIEAATALGQDALANGRHEDALLASHILADVARG
jgi:tetratricopeptide (TPR) repeat protein